MSQQGIVVPAYIKAHVDDHFEINGPIYDALAFNYVHPRFPTVHRTVDGKIAINSALRVN